VMMSHSVSPMTVALRMVKQIAGDASGASAGRQAMKFAVYPALISASLKPSSSLKT
jgi:hypothetical protein